MLVLVYDIIQRLHPWSVFKKGGRLFSSTTTDIAYNNTERLVRLINDILDVEKIEGGHLAFDFRVIDVMRSEERRVGKEV